MNIPTPISIPMTGRESFTASMTVSMTFQLVPDRRPVRADMRKINGIPRDTWPGRNCSAHSRTTSTITGRNSLRVRGLRSISNR